jgi:hypothetical protein
LATIDERVSGLPVEGLAAADWPLEEGKSIDLPDARDVCDLITALGDDEIVVEIRP